MNDIRSYVDSLIPKNIGEKKKKELRDELYSHVWEKAEFYMDIGYTKEQSIQRAIECMGEGENLRESIRSEFEELYHERTVFAVLAALCIVLFNAIGIITLSFESFIDSNNPSPIAYPLSFAMIFATVALTVFAKAKRYRKTLIVLGIMNIVNAGLTSVYMQCGFYAAYQAVIYALELFTPLDTVLFSDGWLYLIYIIPAMMSLYCFVNAYRIKKGDVKGGVDLKKTAVFAVIFLAAATASCTVMPTAESYYYNYPSQFLCNIFIQDEARQLYGNVTDEMSYEEAKSLFLDNGYVSAKDYEGGMSMLEKKQFNHNLKKTKLTFDDDLELYFVPRSSSVKSHTMLYLGKDESGKLNRYGIGQMGEDYTECWAGFYDYADYYTSKSTFTNLQKGDSKDEVLSRFKQLGCSVYGELVKLDSAGKTEIYRLGAESYDENEPLKDGMLFCMELVFENGVFKSGKWHSYEYDPNVKTVELIHNV